MTDVAEAAAPGASDGSEYALRVRDLELAYVVRGIPRAVLRGVSFDVKPGEAYGLVGESGCGKSTTAYAALRYLPGNGLITGGTIELAGTDITDISNRELRDLRATRVSMVYQDPVSSMNPSLRIGRQVAEAYALLGQGKGEALASAREALTKVRIADPDSVMERYPYQLSGGMLQRVVIAMALAGDPELLVLDEPTTGLDATVEAEVLDLIRTLRTETGAAVQLIAHNLGVIRTMCDRVGVMYAGKVVEEGDAQQVFDRPQHPYTMGLLNAIPRKGLRKTDRALFTIPGNLPQIGFAPGLRVCTSTDARWSTRSAAPRHRPWSRSPKATSHGATTCRVWTTCPSRPTPSSRSTSATTRSSSSTACRDVRPAWTGDPGPRQRRPRIRRGRDPRSGG